MRYLLLGMGSSNCSVKNYFDMNKIEYQIYDDKEKNKCDINMDNIDIIIKSPGISNNHNLLKYNKPIITDLELFYQLNKNKSFITVTGSNGKTTTVSIIEHCIKNIEACGNIGIPLFNKTKTKKKLIIEASSFMLEYTSKYRSKYTILLNLNKTHLEHHITYNDYIKSKMKVIRNLLPSDYLIYNYDDIIIRRIVENLDVIKIPFSISNNTICHIKNNYIIYNNKKVYNLNKTHLCGNHNYYNIMATIALIKNYKGKIKKINTFQTISYRLQLVKVINNTCFYNDAKSTNYFALKEAIATFCRKKVLLICGGEKRNDNLNILGDISYIRRVYTYGENGDVFSTYFSSYRKEVHNCKTLEEVIKNLDITNIDIVLFSPGSISHDQYKDYLARGKHFNELLNKYFT